MSIKPPPRLVVRSVHARPASGARHRVAWAAAWLASALLAAVAGYLLASRTPLGHGAHAGLRTLRQQNQDLKQQVATLRQARAIDRVATRRLQGNLADRDQEISGLRADLAFYSRLVGGGKRDGLQLQTVHVQPVKVGSGGWDLNLILTQNSAHRRTISGTVEVALEGIRQHQVARLEPTQLSGVGGADGLGFSFKYFQQLHGTLMLPPGFTPNRLLVTVKPKGADAFTRTVAWADARRKTETINVQPQQ